MMGRPRRPSVARSNHLEATCRGTWSAHLPDGLEISMDAAGATATLGVVKRNAGEA